jgi:hypothetical protein
MRGRVLWLLQERKGHREAATIAAAIYPGRKMTRWGLRVSERGWLGGPVGRLRPSGGAGKVAQMEGRGEQARRG